VHTGPELSIVLVVSMILVVGGLARALARTTSIPHTLLMLLAGLAAGASLKALGTHAHGPLGTALEQAAHVSPHLILFVFLPALVFDSAFSMDYHQFRRHLVTIAVMAVPVLVVNIVLVATLMHALAGDTWGWSLGLCLVFGAVVSATDPVAVVALFRELGAPKRLGLLVEGESLLNDGTAIVAYSVLSAMVLGAGVMPGPGAVTLEFLRVVVGGALVGAALAWGVGTWLGRIFNDPMVEISMTVALAYLAMGLAEGVLHVSGVIAVVVAGLLLSGPLRTRISPEVAEFLHEFWEMFAYLANTLIFWLVGVVAAARLPALRMQDLALVGAVYVGIMVIRFIVAFLVRPVCVRLGEPLRSSECLVLSWGGLRGAVSLALALGLAESEGISLAARDQFLLATSGVVVLTILVNGSTMRWLLERTGFAGAPPAIQVAQLDAVAGVLDHISAGVRAMAARPGLEMVRWAEVEEELVTRREEVSGSLDAARAALADERDQVRGYWVRALDMERQAYWDAFGRGVLSEGALRALLTEVDRHVDCVGAGDLDPPDSRVPPGGTFSGLLARVLRRVGVPEPRLVGLRFRDFTRAYELRLGVVLGAAAVLEGLPEQAAEAPRETFTLYQREAREQLEELRTNLPEVATGVETALARRMAWNFERDEYAELAERGAIDGDTARRARGDVEERMADLRDHPEPIPPPGIRDVLQGTRLFADLDQGRLDALTSVAEEVLLEPGEELFHQGDPGDAVYILARGAAYVLREEGGEEQLVAVLGGGDILGEIALLTECPRTATIRAGTHVTLVAVRREQLAPLLERTPELRDALWDALARHRVLNSMRRTPRYLRLSRADQERWVESSTRRELAQGEPLPRPEEFHTAFVAHGELAADERSLEAPLWLEARDSAGLVARGACQVLLFPESPEGAQAVSGS
jgi:Na+/H+ antiporter